LYFVWGFLRARCCVKKVVYKEFTALQYPNMLLMQCLGFGSYK
jgi:hypothetical protein